jgi:hypothetical protein
MTFEIQVLSWDRHTNVIVKSSKPNRWHGASVGLSPLGQTKDS